MRLWFSFKSTNKSFRQCEYARHFSKQLFKVPWESIFLKKTVNTWCQWKQMISQYSKMWSWLWTTYQLTTVTRETIWPTVGKFTELSFLEKRWTQPILSEN